MSIIQKLQQRQKWVFGAIALALILFIVQDRFMSKGSGLFGGQSSVVGVVDGKNIDYMDYQARIKQAEDQYQAQGYPMNDFMRQNLQEQIWNQYIMEEVMQKQEDQLGLKVSSKEIDDMLFVNPSPQLRQMLTDPKTGQFDPNALKQQIAAIKKKKDKAALKQFNDFINGMVKQRITEKYNSLLGNTAYIPKWMMEKTNTDNSSIASISYVNVPYTTVPDNAVKVTDDDIAAYVDKHKNEYKQETSRSIYYVTFNAAPSSKDSADIKDQLYKLKPEFEKDTNANAFLIRNGSETNFLDDYVSKSKMQMPGKDSIQSLAVGAVYGPYLDANKYTLAKMIGKKDVPDSVKVRHILIKIIDRQKGQIREDSVAKKLIDSIAAAIKGGADFNEMVLKYSEDEGSKNNKGEYDFNISSSLVPAFHDVAFYEPVGTKKVVKGESNDYVGYHYIEVLSQKNFQPAYKVAYLSKSVVPSNETDNTASGAANQFAGESRTAKAFDDNIAKRKYNKLAATDIKPTATNIPGLGDSRQLVKWIYDADKGDVSEVYSVGDKYVVAMVAEINKEGVMSPSKARPMVENLLRNQKKAEIITKKIGSANSLEAVAKAAGVEVKRADSVAFSTGIIPNVGQEAKVVGATFNKQWQGKVTTPIVGNGGVFVIKTENISAVPNANGDLETQRNAMLAQMKQAAGYRSLEMLTKAANVKDNRAKFF